MIGAVAIVARLRFGLDELEKAFVAAVSHEQTAAAEKIRAAADRTREAIAFITDAEIGKTVCDMPVALPKIFVFCNGCGPGWHNMVGIAEDGTPLAGHVCSNHSWANHDMGVDPGGWKRDVYAKHYPNGFDVEYVETEGKLVIEHPGLKAALEKNKANTRVMEVG